MKKFRCIYQHDSNECGLSSLLMIVNHYGKKLSLNKLRSLIPLSKDGVSLLSLSDAAESIGLKSTSLKITLNQLTNEALLPCILHWTQNHFVVLHKVKTKNLFSVGL